MKNIEIETLISDLGMNLEDVELDFYDFLIDSDCLNITMFFNKRNNKIILSFLNVEDVMFLPKKTLSKIVFGKNDDEFFVATLLEMHKKNAHLIDEYQLFSFVDADEKSFLKVVARSYSFKVY